MPSLCWQIQSCGQETLVVNTDNTAATIAAYNWVAAKPTPLSTLQHRAAISSAAPKLHEHVGEGVRGSVWQCFLLRTVRAPAVRVDFGAESLAKGSSDRVCHRLIGHHRLWQDGRQWGQARCGSCTYKGVFLLLRVQLIVAYGISPSTTVDTRRQASRILQIVGASTMLSNCTGR